MNGKVRDVDREAPLRRMTKHLVSTYEEVNYDLYSKNPQMQTSKKQKVYSNSFTNTLALNSTYPILPSGYEDSNTSSVEKNTGRLDEDMVDDSYSKYYGQMSTLNQAANLNATDDINLSMNLYRQQLLQQKYPGFDEDYSNSQANMASYQQHVSNHIEYNLPYAMQQQSLTNSMQPQMQQNSRQQQQQMQYQKQVHKKVIDEDEFVDDNNNALDNGPGNGNSKSQTDYQVHRGELLNNRYLVKDKIGRGSFGQVVSAVDQSTRKMVAIKIIKNRKPFFLQAKTEIALLEELNHKDQGDNYNIVTLVGTFVHRHHQCIVFELLSFNLYDLLKKTNFQGVSLDLVKKFGKQLLNTLTYLEQLQIIHCDLKPENILLRDQKRSLIKIIDFGSSCKVDQRMYAYIQSRFYRAPEVLLGQGYGLEIDMWSLGCILVELHTGEPLFCGSNEYEQMMRIACLKGMPESYLLENSQKVLHYFSRRTAGGWKFDLNKAKHVKTNNGTVSWTGQAFDPNAYPRSLEQVFGLDKTIMLNPTSATLKVFQRRCKTSGHSLDDYMVFIDLLTKMLEYDPAKRIKPWDALNHRFFQGYSDNAGQQVPIAMQNLTRHPSRILEGMQMNPLLQSTSTLYGINALPQQPQVDYFSSHASGNDVLGNNYYNLGMNVNHHVNDSQLPYHNHGPGQANLNNLYPSTPMDASYNPTSNPMQVQQSYSQEYLDDSPYQSLNQNRHFASNDATNILANQGLVPMLYSNNANPIQQQNQLLYGIKRIGSAPTLNIFNLER